SGTTNVTKTISDIPRVVTVTPEPGYSTGAVTKPEISVTFENGGAGSTATVKIDKAEPVAMTVTDSKATYAPASDLATGRHDIVVTITRADGAVGTRSWFFNVGDPTYQFYFGQLHSHTGQYSDGSGTLADGLNHLAGISDEDSVDFASFTDHSNYFDEKDKANPETALAKPEDMTTASAAKWKQYKDDITAHNTANGDTRRALAGFEMTWSGGPGHINTFNSNGIISRNNKALNNKAGDAGMKLYYETLKDPANAGTISQFNHPGTTFGTFSDFAYLDPIIDERINLIEVGNGEGAIGSGGYFPSYQYYIRALDKGWHLAPTNNQDNHKGNVGNGNTARSVVVSSAAMSEQTLLDGMKSMSMYATEDKNLEIMYTLNGLVMGSSTTETPGTVNIKATIKDPDATDKVGLVEVVANGGVVAASQSYASQTAEVSFDLPANYSYYFLRVTQPDRDIAVTAPVWIGSVPKVGISSITCPTLVPVAGEALDFTTTMYNLETEDYTISKLEYVEERLGKETVLKTETPSKIIGGVDHKDFAYSYIPSLEKLGFVTLIVRVTGTLGSTPMNLEQSYTFEVLDPATLTTIGIDGGHSNFYVTGNYNDSDAALVGMAGRSSVRAVRLAKNELTYDKIKDMKMVILTVPFKEFGASVSDCVYTEAELNALKTYAENGGNFIITSKSDRGDPSGTGEQASVITNGILTAIGAKARVEKAIVIDPVRKANESYRITLGGDSAADQKCFNYASKDPLAAKILNGVQRNTNNLFSAYNSAPIIPNGAVPIVSGFPDTTWGTNFNTLDSDNKYAPTDASTELTAKGATHLITAETLTGGGFCIVSGVTFFSTFEVKPELDNATQKQNTNYQIVQNILDQVKPDSEPTAISEVHKAPEGTRFTIEGIATSNASGYDRSTAFFDCIYVQDKTGGINVFPVAGTIQEGQTVQVTGYTSSYNGERQLQATYYKVIDDAVNKVAPTAITTKQAASGDKLGALVSVTGVIASVKTAAGGEIESIMVRGADGYTARVFIDGYITSEKVIKDAVVGNDITAVGLVSHDTEGYRLRIRDRADIICTVPYNPAPRPKPVEPKPDAPVVEVKQEAAVGKDGTSASAAISNQDLNAALKNANKSGSTEIIISAALPKEGADKVTSLTVSLPSGALSSVAGNKNLDLTVATPSGSVTFGNEAVKALGKETNVAVCTAVAGADVTFTVSANGKPIEKLAGGFAAAVPAAKVTAGTVLMVVNADGTTTILPKSVADADTVKGLLDGNATLRVADNTKSFGDVAANHWGSSSVAFVSSHGLFQGTGEKLFSPEANTSRGMLITALYRLEGTPATKGEAPADVAKDSWYNQSAAWAKELGISNNDKLEGDREISRQELVTMAYRYAKAMKLDLTPTAKLDSFTDGDKVADWAKDAMSWAVSIGLVKGVPGGGLAPDDLASRAQISAIMERLVSYMVK
ncbi:MAG: CehA/McbA family metallohydrolase, partial [Oscillospiraceae bacterium]